jgi:hypothetical protein
MALASLCSGLKLPIPIDLIDGRFLWHNCRGMLNNKMYGYIIKP